MNYRTLRALAPLCAIATALTIACSDTLSPRGEPNDGSFVAPQAIQQKPEQDPSGVRILSGFDADTALRAFARFAAGRGDAHLAAYVDTSAAWNAAGRQLGVSALRAPGPLPSLHDITGTGTPPDPFDPKDMPRPTIDRSSTTATIAGSVATFSTTMSFSGGTDGSSSMTWDVHNTDGSIQFAPRTTLYTAVASGIGDCILQILSGVRVPACVLMGTVKGMSSVNLSKACDVQASATALHNAGITLPWGHISVNSQGNWTIAFTTADGPQAYPVGDAIVTGNGPACQVQQRRVITDNSGGDSGGEYIMFPDNGDLHCFADQERTVYQDGSAGPWYTVSIDCSFYDVGASTDGTVPGASRSSKGVKYAGPQFTLAAVASLPGHVRAQIIRRSAPHAADGDVIVIPANSATPDDLAEAVAQYLSDVASKKPGDDMAHTVTAARGNTGKASRTRDYARLLGAVKQAAHTTVDGLGDAATIKVLVGQ